MNYLPALRWPSPGAPVELEGKTLFRVRINAKTQTATERAEKFSEVILQLAQDPLFKPSTITVKDFGLSSDVMAGDKILVPVWIFEAKLEGRPVEELAREYAERIRQAIAAYQKEHSLSNLIRGIVKTTPGLFDPGSVDFFDQPGNYPPQPVCPDNSENPLGQVRRNWNFLTLTASRPWSSMPLK